MQMQLDAMLVDAFEEVQLLVQMMMNQYLSLSQLKNHRKKVLGQMLAQILLLEMLDFERYSSASPLWC